MVGVGWDGMDLTRYSSGGFIYPSQRAPSAICWLIIIRAPFLDGSFPTPSQSQLASAGNTDVLGNASDGQWHTVRGRRP